MKHLLCIILIVFLWLPLLATRKALVIGNAEYPDIPLRNPINDANLIANELKELGFKVDLILNANQQMMDRTFNSFISSLNPEDDVLFYYSGHGANYSGENYLIPVGKVINAEEELRYYAFNSNLALERLQRAKMTVMVLDACRDNPFKGTRSGNRGLASMQGKAGSQYIIYSTEQGKTAADGSGSYSPFTESFAKYIKSPERIEDIMKKVTLEVKIRTNDKQIPWTAGNLIEDFYLASAGSYTEKRITTSAQKQPGLEKLCGNLRITTDFETEIFINHISQGLAKVGYALTTGDIDIGNCLIEFFRDNAKFGILTTIYEGRTTFYDLKLTEIIALLTKSPSLIIKSDPSPAELSFAEFPNNVVKTPFLIVDSVPLQYNLTLKSNRFENLTQQITSVNSTSSEITFVLKPTFANLKLISEPTKSKVFVNGTLIGTTPLDFTGSQLGLDPGKYSITIVPTNDSYITVQRDVELFAGKSYVEKITHPLLGAYLTIDSDYFPIRVNVNGIFIKELRKSDTIRVIPGDIVLSIEPIHDGSIPMKICNMNLHISQEEHKPVYVRLIPNKGTVTFYSNYPQYKLTVYEKSNRNNKILSGNCLIAYPGDYSLKASAWGYYAIQKDFTLIESIQRDEKIAFEPLPKNFLKRYQGWRQQQLYGIVSLSASLGVSAYMYYRANHAYQEYQTANSPYGALDTRKNFEDKRNQFYETCSINLIPIGYYLFSVIKTYKAKSAIITEMYSRLGGKK